MKTPLRLLGLLWALVPLGAHAQGTCGTQTNSYNFATAPANVDWKANNATVGITTLSTSGFSSTGNVATFATVSGAGIRWAADYSAVNGTSTVTYTFSRAVTNLRIVVADIDRNIDNGNNKSYQDAVTFNGHTSDAANGTDLITLAAGNIVNSRPLTVSGNTVSDQAGGNDLGGTTTVTFPQAVKKLVLTFSNTYSGNKGPGPQSIDIASLSWCKLTPTAANESLTASYLANPSINVLSNDTYDGTFTLDLNPATPAVDAVFTNTNGVTFTAAANGLVTVTNPSKYVGVTSLTYQLKDDAGQTASATLTATLTNAAPVASDYTVTRSYSDVTPINLLAGVTDADGNASIDGATLDLNPSLARRQATYTVANQGTFTVDDNGLVSFAPLNGFVGTSTLSYTVQDEKGLTSAVKTLRLTTTSAAPVAVNDAATRSNTARAPIYILTNDTDPDNDINPAAVDLDPSTPAQETSYTDAGKGTYTVDGFGLIAFTALNNFVGTSTLTYLVRDAKGLASNTATLTLTVTQTLANDDSNVTPTNNAVSGNVLINDNNRVGTNLQVSTTPVTPPANGTVVIQASGNYTYTPRNGYVGDDFFVYRATDGSTSSEATVRILVYNPAVACTQATGPNLLKNPDFTLGNTGFQTDYTYVANQAGVNNELVPEGLYSVGSSAADYHPNFAQNGFSGAATDNFLMINGSNTIKKLYSQTVKVEPNKYYNFSAYVNNILAQNTTTTADDPVFGFVINGVATSEITSIPETPNTWVQLSDIWFSGNNTTATFEIVNVSIVAGGNDMGIDKVYFGTCNEAPVAQSDLVLVPAVVPTAFSVISNDLDDGGVVGSTVRLYAADGSGAGTQSLTTAQGSYVVDATTGLITYTPAAGFTGSTAITYRGLDEANATTATTLITVRVGPITANDAQNMTGQRVATLDVVANDQDVDGVDPASVDLDPSTPGQDVSLVVANKGVFQVNASGIVTFTPVATFSGTVVIPYLVRDFVGAQSNQGTITVTLDRPLPVELTQFRAVAKQADALLSWETATETNSNRFEVERSTDARTFSRVATLKAQGTTARAHAYTHLDAQARKAGLTLYYRLRQVDNDGSFQYSEVRTVRFAAGPAPAYTFGVLPNPTAGTTKLDLTSLPAGAYTVEVHDVTGRLLLTSVAAGAELVPLDVRSLPQGVYIVQVHNSTLRAAQRLVKE